MDLLSLDRWRLSCTDLGLSGSDFEHRKLLRAWSGWGRHYHSVKHLAACLGEFDRVRELARRPAEVEMALWFHDAIYRTYRTDNEARSAAWAPRFLAGHGATLDIVSRITDSVLATAHTDSGLGGDAALVVDIDLAILGQAPDVYAEFERDVRREYWWVPRRLYAASRIRVLQAFIARPAIYHWQPFRERYETAARANLGRAITGLGSR